MSKLLKFDEEARRGLEAGVERIELASFFSVRVDRFFHFKGDLRGIVGTVTSVDHIFSSLNVVAAEMLVGEHDFTERLCYRWDLWIGPGEPTREEWPRIEGVGVVDGYGTVGASRAVIEAFFDEPRQRE